MLKIWCSIRRLCVAQICVFLFATVCSAATQSSEIVVARKLLSDGKFQQARAFLDAHRLEGASNPDFRMVNADLLRLTGRTDEAISEYQQVALLAPANPEPLIALSELYLQNLQLQKSLSAAREAVAIKQDSVVARLALASVLLKTDQLAEADRQIARLITLSPGNPEVQLLLYRLDRKKGDLEGARKALEFVMAKAEKKDPSWQVELADLKEAEGAYAEARKYLESVIQADPGFIEARYRLARLLEFRYHDYIASAAAYKDILRLSPQSSDALSGLERSRRKQRDIAFRLKSAIRQLMPAQPQKKL